MALRQGVDEAYAGAVTSIPAPAAQVRRAYVDQAAISYSFYVVGASAAFIAVAL